MMSVNWAEIASIVSNQLGQPFLFEDHQPVGGGCINETWKVTDQHQQHWFIKFNKPSRLNMFEAEAQGLEEIRKTDTIRVPKPLCTARSTSHAFIVMEHIAMHSNPSPTRMGEQLAAMHHTTAHEFGWFRDNTIGSTPQINTPHGDWIRFWQDERMKYQLELAASKGFSSSSYDAGLQLCEHLPALFNHYQPKASLLHGDLWSGNCNADSAGQPIIYDPAVYYGDHEADLAMTELFGGFGPEFFAAYATHFHIDPGYKTRKTLYNLYHILNHYNLFGGGYGQQAHGMIQDLLAAIT